MKSAETGEVLAAGGVIARTQEEILEVLVVHRPRYDDWSFPKGKLDPGESFEEAAVREVLEETGLECRLGSRLSTVRYRVADGRSKEVRYWLMSVERGDIEARQPDHEIDQLRWIVAETGLNVLTHVRDRELLSEVLARVEDGRGRLDEA